MTLHTHLRLTGCAALATLAAGCALLPLVDPGGWLAVAAALVVGQAAVGALARRFRLARPLVPGVQLLVSLLLLTAVFAGREALLGVLPSPEVFARFELLFREGVQDVTHYATPAPASEGIRLMLVSGVLLIGLLVDTLAVTYRSAAPAGLPLLALYSVAAGLSQGRTNWVWFLCAATGYLLLLLAEGRERLLRWGRVFGGVGAVPGVAGDGDKVRGRPPVPRTGRRIGVAALGIALAVPAALPPLGSGLLDGPRRADDGSRDEDGVTAVNPLVALQDNLNQPEDRVALTYRTTASDTDDMYLRIVTLDRFDGASWQPSERRLTDVPDRLPRPPGLAPDVRTESVTTRLRTADWYAQTWLPMPYPADRVRVDGRWRFEPEGRTLVGDHGQTTQGLDYEVESLRVLPTAERLVNAPRPPRRLLAEYTEVPASLPSVVRQQAREVTSGARTDYQRALRLQQWFTRDGGFTYDTRVQVGSGSAAIVNFLRDREGFCAHFAFSMAAMSRTLGIPARVAVGFTSGTPRDDGWLEVHLQDAHAWPELYFEGVGWTRFEPTPSRGDTPSYARPDSPDSSPAPDGERPDSEESPSPDGSSSPPPGCAEDDNADGACASDVVPGGGRADDGPTGGWLPGVGATALAVLTLLAVPSLWRARLRARRLRGTPPPVPGTATVAGGNAVDATLRAQALAAWAEVQDLAWDFGFPPDRAATPRTTASRLVRLGGLRDQAATAAHRLARATEEALYAPRPRDHGGALAEAVTQVRAGLRAGAGRRQRLRALLLPRSAVRLAWAARARWKAVAERVRPLAHRVATVGRPARGRTPRRP